MDITINLLPPDKKEELKNLRIAGVVFKIGLSALLALLTLYAFMFFCVKAIVIYKSAFDLEVERFRQSESYVEVQKAQNEIRKKSEQARQIKGGLLQKTDYWSVFERINAIIPDDIYLKQIKISENTIQVNGLALKRQSLLVFEQKMDESETFSDVESPISNLVANENVDFELKAVINR